MIKTIAGIEILNERKELFREMIESGIFRREDPRRSEKENIKT